MNPTIEDLLMAHRYLYYVIGANVLSDHEYDVIERHARTLLPQESPIQRVGSSLPSSYTAYQIDLAESMPYVS